MTTSRGFVLAFALGALFASASAAVDAADRRWGSALLALSITLWNVQALVSELVSQEDDE